MRTANAQPRSANPVPRESSARPQGLQQSRKATVRPTVERAEAGRAYYFAFGANVNKAVVQRRRLQPRRSIAGTVHNYKLYFNHVGGYGNIGYRPGDASRPDVQGVLHDLSEAEMRSLALTETGYDVREVLVDTGNGVTVAARAFMSNWALRLFQETSPTKLYIGKIRAGASDFGLSDDYQEWLASVEADAEAGHQRDSLLSPSTLLAGAFVAGAFAAVNWALLGAARRR